MTAENQPASEVERELAALISDAEIVRVHGNANFGPTMSPRGVVNDGVHKSAVGYHCGHTQFSILRDHGLITKPRGMSYDVNLTKKGKRYFRALSALQARSGASGGGDGASAAPIPTEREAPSAYHRLPGREDEYRRAVMFATRDKPSCSYVQRRMCLTFNAASAHMERMEAEGLISAANYAGKREILVPWSDAEPSPPSVGMEGQRPGMNQNNPALKNMNTEGA